MTFRFEDRRMNLPWWKDKSSRDRLIAEMRASGRYTLRYLGRVFGLSHVHIRNIGRGEP
jgi:hypothetical protein